MNASDIPAVSVAVLQDGRFLLVQRGHAPSRGLYAFPGGRVRAGETAREAVQRELREETGLMLDEFKRFGEIIIPAENGRNYRLDVFCANRAHGVARPGDDASRVGWYTIDEMRALPITESTLMVAEKIASGCTSM